MKIENSKSKGFSLVELLVSVAITSIIMVGISAFFSNGFQTMFTSSKNTSDALSQLVFSNILQKNFIKADSLEQISEEGTSIILKNNPAKTPLSFTYIGLKEAHLGVKDFFVFNGQEGSTTSLNFSETVAHPAGLTQLGDKYYVAAPLENAIYECSNSCDQKLPLEGLKYPMDLANDGANLYFTDAGNNRVVKIEDVGNANNLTVLAEGLNFPTGIEYYDEGEKYLFVSDTYNHVVKKIQISGAKITTVVGNGTNKACDNTAEFCQLSYPTGLVIGDEGAGEALYIADTGHGRILKMFNPAALSEFEMTFSSPETPEAFKEIKIVFPTGTNLGNNPLNSVSSDNSTFNENGTLSIAENTLTYELWTKLLNDTKNTNACAPQPCLILKNKIEVINHQLFDNNQFNELKLGDDPNNNFPVSSKAGVKVGLSKFYASDHLAGAEVVLTKPVSANTTITFKFSSVDATAVSGGFKPVLIQMYDSEGKFLASQKVFFRFPDQELGTPEDMISVSSPDLSFPTGLGWSGNALVFSDKAQYPEAFTDFDYVTDFEVEAFKMVKKDEGKLLEINFKTQKNPSSEEEEKIYDNHVFNAALNP